MKKKWIKENKKPVVKIRKPKLSFAERLASKIKHLGQIDVSISSTNSVDSGWVNIYLDELHYISFWLTNKGDGIERITIRKDIVGVVDTKQIAATKMIKP